MSALYFNKVILCGRLTADTELRMTQSGRNVVTFTIAVNRRKAADSEGQQADFLRCVAWDKTAEFINKYFHKGDSLFVTGEQRTRSYKDKDGRTVYVTENVIDEARFVDSKAATDTQLSGGELPNFEEADPDADLPF